MTGFTWVPPSSIYAERRRASRANGSSYTPIEEKEGLLANHGRQLAASLVAFLSALVILVFGWGHHLDHGGPMYYLAALAGVAFTAALPAHIVLQHRRLQRIADGLD